MKLFIENSICNEFHINVFYMSQMLEDKGNTAVYLLYAYTRIKSIARKAGISLEQLREFVVRSSLNLSHEKEIKLIKVLTP